MLIAISRPVFKSEMDENIFVSRLFGLPNSVLHFDCVIDKKLGVYLTPHDNSMEATMAKL